MTDGAPKKKAKVRPLVRGYAGDEPNAAPGWTSPLAEIEPPPGDTLSASWKIQDKTHLEFTIDYPIALGSYTWESYFFVPDSLRLRQMTYDKKQIYDDLLSYVRMQAPKMSLGLLAISFSMGQSGPF